MKRWLWILALMAVLAAVVWFVRRPSPPPGIPFAKVTRETLTSFISTNGKTEPLEWAPVHAARGGVIAQVPVEKGREVGAGTVLAVLDDSEAQAALTAAEARLEQARAELANFQRGGRSTELADIDSGLAKLAIEKEAAARDVASFQRLVKAQAATPHELQLAQDRLDRIDADIAAQRRKREALVTSSDRAAAEARVRDAEAAIRLAKEKIEQSVIRAPRQGVLYDLAVRTGDWLQPGAPIGKIGNIDKLRVTIYIDEPDLGRVRLGLPVTLTWDALPGKEWSGVVDRVPTQVIPLGTRQVGEALSIAATPGRDLPPGANINARVRTDIVENALTIPKAALRREGSELGVFLLKGDAVSWLPVRVGASSESRAQVIEGLTERDAVALPGDRLLRAGMTVTPLFP